MGAAPAAQILAIRAFSGTDADDGTTFAIMTGHYCGSHAVLKHLDGKTTVVPLHSGETIGPGLLRAILRDVEMSVENFLKLC